MNIHKKFTFFKKFFTQPGKNASIWPTSNNAAELLCGSVAWEKVKTVLELGPGTGPVTAYIFQSMPSSATYYGLEYEQEYVSLLNEQFPDHAGSFIQGNVKDLSSIMVKNSIPFPDVIISTLPNSVFETYPHLVNELASYLKQGTVFRGITYAPELLLDVYKDIKPKVIGHTWKNIPPLYVHGVN